MTGNRGIYALDKLLRSKNVFRNEIEDIQDGAPPNSDLRK